MSSTSKKIITRTLGTIKDWKAELERDIKCDPRVTAEDLIALLSLVEDLAESVRIMVEMQEWRGRHK